MPDTKATSTLTKEKVLENHTRIPPPAYPTSGNTESETEATRLIM